MAIKQRSKSAGFEEVRLDNVLEPEQREYNDILQWDVNDRNLALKPILFLQWKERNCSLNGDNDVFANKINMVDYFQSLNNNTGNGPLFIGHLIWDAGPIREPHNKNYNPVQAQESNSYPLLLRWFTSSCPATQRWSYSICPSSSPFFPLMMFTWHYDSVLIPIWG